MQQNPKPIRAFPQITLMKQLLVEPLLLLLPLLLPHGTATAAAAVAATVVTATALHAAIHDAVITAECWSKLLTVLRVSDELAQ